jgi:tetratricopeptide (TPR) repeat protein
MTRPELRALVRMQGGTFADRLDAEVTLIVVADDCWPLSESARDELFDEVLRQALADGRLELVGETQLWQRLGLVETESSLRLYTPAMLASLLRVPVSVVRRWHRRGLITPTRTVRKLPYFDFEQVTIARRLAELVAAGASATAIESQLDALAKFLPAETDRAAQLTILVEGRRLLLRQGDGLIDAVGQLQLDFESWSKSVVAREDGDDASSISAGIVRLPQKTESLPGDGSPDAILAAAQDLEEDGRLEEAAAAYRTLCGLAGPTADTCFHLAEILYRLGELPAARERYYMAVELDENYVEARANLGCVLAESGQTELAVAAFEGALAIHPEYPDAHYHLARTLDELGRAAEADSHWRRFLALAPDSPWACEARERLEMSMRDER